MSMDMSYTGMSCDNSGSSSYKRTSSPCYNPDYSAMQSHDPSGNVRSEKMTDYYSREAEEAREAGNGEREKLCELHLAVERAKEDVFYAKEELRKAEEEKNPKPSTQNSAGGWFSWLKS